MKEQPNLPLVEKRDVLQSAPGEHKFVFDRVRRRMVCSVCGGLMNECPTQCKL